MASSNPSRRNSAMMALRKSCSCTDTHLKTHNSPFISSLLYNSQQVINVTEGRISLDGGDVSRGKHLIKRIYHMTHSHQSCGRSVCSRVFANLCRPAADVQTSASIARQSSHLQGERRILVNGPVNELRSGEMVRKIVYLPGHKL